MIRLSFIIACLLLPGVAQIPSETDWRGLAPIKSTRMDVERTLGPPSNNSDNGLMMYRFHDMDVDFYFTSNANCQQKLPYTSWNVTADTLTGIDVTLSRSALVADTGIDLTKYTKLKAGGDLLERYYYLNADDSFIIEVANNYLAGYHYRPGGKQKHLRCEPSKHR